MHRSRGFACPRPIGAQALRAVGDATRSGNGRRLARRRQRLRYDLGRGRRTRRDRAGRFLRRRRRAIAGERIAVEASGVRTTGGGNAHQSEDCNARPRLRTCTRTRQHAGTRHVVTHSYTEYVELEIKQSRVNKLLRITGSLPAHVSPAKMSQSFLQFLRLPGQ